MDINSKNPTSVFSLEDLFGGSLTLVIPDMQRDFTWGGHRAEVLVRGIALPFAADSGKQGFCWSKTLPVPLGTIYGFTTSNRHIHIIDGQQRLTTLYLLIGMLYRRTSLPQLKPLLIGKYNNRGDEVPRILYQSKREAFYFMNDLVTHFFLNRDGRLSQLEQSAWYCMEYDADITVQNFISAIRTIDSVLEEFAGEGFDFEGLAQYVVKDLSVLYCDLQDRPKAEETFVTLNTTGEPLTAGQKARTSFLLASAGESASRYNEMEDFFWEQREMYNASTCDEGLERFLSLVEQARSLDLLATDNGLAEHTFALFKAYQRLCQCDIDTSLEKKPSAQRTFLLLPTLAFIRHFPEAEDKKIVAFARFLEVISRYQRPGWTDVQMAITMARTLKNEEIGSIMETKHVSPRILPMEERAKFMLLEKAKSWNNPSMLEELRETLQRGEDHPMLWGRMAKIIDWCRNAADETLAAQLKHYVDAFYQIWGSDIDCREDLDDVRRALLAIQTKGYPMARRGDTMFSLCWHDYDWQRLMATSPGIVRQLIDRLEKNTLKGLAEKFSDRGAAYFVFIKDKSLLKYCRKRQLMRPCEPFVGYYDMDKEANRWMVEGRELKLPPQWGPLRSYGSRCLYSDHRKLNMAIDLYYTPEAKRPYRVEFFNRPSQEGGRKDTDLSRLGREATFSPHNERAFCNFRYDKARSRYFALFSGSRDALDAIKRISESI